MLKVSRRRSGSRLQRLCGLGQNGQLTMHRTGERAWWLQEVTKEPQGVGDRCTPHVRGPRFPKGFEAEESGGASV